MKRTAAILLCIVLLFNWVGYRLAISYLQDQAGMQLESKLDADEYDASQLISLKVPATHLSFYTNSGQFERTTGEVEIKGILYKYVKKRFCNDSLEFICIADHAGMKWRSVKNEFFKQVNDLQQNAGGKKTGSFPGAAKNFIADYYLENNLFNLDSPSFLLSKNRPGYVSTLPPVELFTAEQPPETIS